MLLVKILIYFAQHALSATKLIEYQFYNNFGQIFHDYSDNNQYAVNGVDSTTTTKDTKPTDRGAYFAYSSENYIFMPYNDVIQTYYTIPSSFSIIIWMNPEDSSIYYIFYRKCLTCSNYFYVGRDAGPNSIIARIVQGSFDSTSVALSTVRPTP